MRVMSAEVSSTSPQVGQEALIVVMAAASFHRSIPLRGPVRAMTVCPATAFEILTAQRDQVAQRQWSEWANARRTPPGPRAHPLALFGQARQERQFDLPHRAGGRVVAPTVCSVCEVS